MGYSLLELNCMHYVAAAADLQMAREEYDKFDFCVRKLLWQRAVLLSGQERGDSALAARDNFVQVCLLGQRPGSHAGPPSVEQAAQVCITQTSGHLDLHHNTCTALLKHVALNK